MKNEWILKGVCFFCASLLINDFRICLGVLLIAFAFSINSDYKERR